MSTSINWGRLYEQGRCKNIGVPWSEAEAKARAAGIPAEFVRKGVLTWDEYQESLYDEEQLEEQTGTIALTKLKKDELRGLAEQYGVERLTSAATKAVIMEELKKAGCPERVRFEDVEGVA